MDRPTPKDIEESRKRQQDVPHHRLNALLETLEPKRSAPTPQEPSEIAPGTEGLKTVSSSAYEASLGGEKKNMTSFEVKAPPGRL